MGQEGPHLPGGATIPRQLEVSGGLAGRRSREVRRQALLGRAVANIARDASKRWRVPCFCSSFRQVMPPSRQTRAAGVFSFFVSIISPDSCSTDAVRSLPVYL